MHQSDLVRRRSLVIILVWMAIGVMVTDSPSPSQAQTSLTLVTYNVHLGVPMGSELGIYRAGLAELQAQSEVITSATADVVALQEVDSEYGLMLPVKRQRSSCMAMPRLYSHFANMAYIFGSVQDDIRYPSDNAGYLEWGEAGQWKNNGAVHGEVGNVLLTRHPLAAPPENLPLPKLPEKERRACIRAEIAVSGAPHGRIVVFATHLQHDSPESRTMQMQCILDRAAADQGAGNLVFIMGDLNHGEQKEAGKPGANPISLAEKAGFHDLAMSFARSRQEAPEPTFPADKPESRIDYIFASQPLSVLNAEVLPTNASDHRPLKVSVALPAK